MNVKSSLNKSVGRAYQRRLHVSSPPANGMAVIPAIAAGAVSAIVFIALVVLTWQTDLENIPLPIEVAQIEEELPPLEEVALPEPTHDEAPPTEEIVAVSLPLPDLPATPILPNPIAPPTPPRPVTVPPLSSPVIFKGISGCERQLSGRQSALHRYGGTGEGEVAVLRALRYLKSLQHEDGSWHAKGEGNATAFALLVFLTHGEGVDSKEFGDVVRRALNYIRRHSGSNMAVYALVEAAGVIRTPILVEEAEAALSKLCQRQKQKINANAGGVIPRYCGVMALIAAKLAGLRVPEAAATQRRLTEAYLAMRDAKPHDTLHGKGLWHYMVATVCLQYLGHGNDPPTQSLLRHLFSLWPPATLATTEIACCPVRSNLFATTMFFNAGGATWKRWNEGMISAYVKSQTIAGDCGYWFCQDQHIGAQPFWPTCYIALQLMTYYRYLPTSAPTVWQPRPAPRKVVDFLQGLVIEVEI